MDTDMPMNMTMMEDGPAGADASVQENGTISTEDRYSAPFFRKIPLVIERGEGVWVYDDTGRRYLDFTAGWGVTCLGHASPVITQALVDQSRRIVQGPEAGRTYSPVRAELLRTLGEILPAGLDRVFFTNSGAEANDAAIKLARKATGKRNVIAVKGGFHGRTIGTVSATGQAAYRDRYDPLMPNYLFVPYDDVPAVAELIKNDVAAVIVEPIQGEGGVRVPSDAYLEKLGACCRRNGAYLILDEVQTGFFRTGTPFASSPYATGADLMTMGKGIAGGFPFGAFALSERVARRLEAGDHGGTYCGNPLGCAVAGAVVRYLIDSDIADNVRAQGTRVLDTFRVWRAAFPELVADARGRGLLAALELVDEAAAQEVRADCLGNGLIVNVTQKKVLRVFPALTITPAEMTTGLDILARALVRSVRSRAVGRKQREPVRMAS